MSKKKYKSYKREKTDTKAFSLHTDAIDKLVDAENAPEVSEVEINKYKNDKLAKIPIWVKALFIKFWFNGAVCFFFMWGLSLYITAPLDLAFVVAIAMGAVTDLLVNPILGFFDVDGKYTKWAIFPVKKFWSLFANIAYSIVIIFFVMIMQFGLTKVVNAIVNGGESTIYVGVEPFLFALMYLIVDLIFIGIKCFISKLIADANKKLDEEEKNLRR